MNNFDRIDEECWALDYAMARHILPRLLWFKNIAFRPGIPTDFYIHETGEDFEDEWDEVLGEMIWAFRFVLDDYPSLVAQAMILPENEGIRDWFKKPIRYEEGVDLEKLKRQDDINMARCYNGLRLFAKYYMDLWT